jgi:predicted Zn-dependent protease with MMP-like domain
VEVDPGPVVRGDQEPFRRDIGVGPWRRRDVERNRHQGIRLGIGSGIGHHRGYDTRAMTKRRRGSARTGRRTRPAHHERFDRLVDRAVAGIPDPFRAALDEIALVIADEPSPEQLHENGLGPDETLYGLYEGVPLGEWGGDWVPVPTRIIVFRLPLEEDFPDPLDLADEVRITILHELAHHLGIEDEGRLAELGID